MSKSSDRNKRNAEAFYDLMFNQCKPREAIELYAGDEYVQHNPHVADGKEAFIKYFDRMASEYPGKTTRFVRSILVNERMDNLASYFDGDNYLQHNPQIGDGLSGLSTALDAMTDAGVTMKYDRVHKVLGKGSFVLVVSEGYFVNGHTSFYDLFRVRDGKIAEHWDTNQRIPPRSDWKNDNGKFGFPQTQQ